MREAVKDLATSPRECKCGSALKNAIFTAPDLWPEATTRKLAAIIGKYRN
jgi:5'-methylthioadenosine phosphorylase